MTSRGTKYWNSGSIPLIAPDILGDIISEVADIGIVIDDSGKVLSVLINPNFQVFRALEKLEGTDIRSAMTSESIVKFDERLARFLDKAPDIRPIEVNHADKTKHWEFPVRYSFHHVGPDGAILLLGRDLRPVAEMQQQLVKAQLALERDYESQREYETRFRVLMESTSDAIVLVSLQTGKIVDTNARAVALMGQTRDRLIGADFSSRFESRKRGDVLDRLSNHVMSEAEGPFTAQITGQSRATTVHANAFRVSGERLLLCRIMPVGPSETAVDHLSDNLRQLYQRGPDAMVFTAEDGLILSANESFLDLLGSANDASLKGKSIADFMQRGSVDLKVMAENATRTGKMRVYVTKVAGEYGSPRNVEVSVTALQAGATPILAFVLREANRTDLGGSSRDPSEDSMKSVVELVGSATLKDIVAETTNVVEKMCIETAVELTMNNRVAAAEMLGLSRQSLYVKLRKFDMLSRDVDDQ